MAGVVLVEVPNPDVVVNRGSDGVVEPINVKRVVWVNLLGAREDKKPGGGITTRDPGWPRMVMGWAWGARSSASTRVAMRSCWSRLALCRSATRAVVSCW